MSHQREAEHLSFPDELIDGAGKARNLCVEARQTRKPWRSARLVQDATDAIAYIDTLQARMLARRVDVGPERSPRPAEFLDARRAQDHTFMLDANRNANPLARIP